MDFEKWKNNEDSVVYYAFFLQNVKQVLAVYIGRTRK